jgi:asparagine synthase (glutamine-hydrolysing)
MCGIICTLGVDIKSPGSLNHRGPDGTERTKFGRCSMEFARLAINDKSYSGMQPFYRNDKILVCNGEIYNYKKLYEMMGVTPQTHSDCEVIIHLYKRYGIQQCLRMLDGYFAFILVDGDTIYVARDAFGVRPLFVA